MQPARTRRGADHRRVTTPFPLAHILHHASAYRVEYDVGRELQQVTVALDQDALEAPLEDVTHTAVTAIELLGIHAIQLAHPGRKVAFGGFDDQMIVIGHLAPGMDGPVVALAALGQGFQPDFAVDVVDKDILAPIPARGHVIKTAREFEPHADGTCGKSRSEKCYIARPMRFSFGPIKVMRWSDQNPTHQLLR